MSNFRSVRRKITLGYIVLAIAVITALWYIVNQMNKISVPNQEIVTETSKTFAVSNIITDVLASESFSRTAILSGQNQDINRYHNLIDSIQQKIDTLKTTFTSVSTNQKLDTIQHLLTKKEARFDEIILSRRQFLASNDFSGTLKNIEKAKQEINRNSQTNDSLEKTGGFFSRLADGVADAVNSERKREREKKKLDEINQLHQAKSDSISKITEQMLSQAVLQKRKAQQKYFAKEAQLIEESKAIAQKISVLFEEIEQSVTTAANQRIAHSKAIINQTSTNLAWLGALSIFSIIILSIIVLIDLKKSYKNKLRVEQLNTELERLIKQKNYFLASITHDMVSPLNTTIGFSDLLANTLQTDQQKKYLNNIQHSTKYIKNLVSDLVDFSKLEHDRISLNKSLFHPQKLFDETISILQPEADKKQIELNTDYGDNLDNFIFSDEQRIRQILINLLTNAIKFTHEGSVTLKADIEDQQLLLEVIDTGIGIDTAHHKTIFLEFRQAHDDIEKTYGGTGLGLNITKRLIDLFGGEINFESTLGQGTIFAVKIPLEEAKNTDNQNTTNNYLIDEDALQNINLLVVDDDNFQLQLMNEIFAQKVRKFYCLSDGNSIDEYLQKHHIDLVLTDIQMPKITGFELLKRIHKLEPSLPVIALTGKADLEEKNYLDLGFSAVVKKPIDLNLLMEKIHKTLNIEEVKRIEKPTPVFVNTNSTAYDFTDIIKLTGNDLSMITPILQTFISTTQQALGDLQTAVKHQNHEQTAQLAHRILPMFRQLHINEPIEALENLERNPEQLNAEKAQTYWQIVNNCLDTIEKDWKTNGYI